MKPESRIKLIRLLEEIEAYQGYNLNSKINYYFVIGFFLIYPFVSVLLLDRPFKESMYFVLNVIPVTIIFIWFTFRNKLEERYKLLASAVLELGSVAQESHSVESQAKIVEQKTTKIKKQTTTRKKKK